MTEPSARAKKKCTKCGERKHLADFHPKRDNRDGRRNQCRVCVLAHARAWDRKRRASPEYRPYRATYLRHRRQTGHMRRKDRRDARRRLAWPPTRKRAYGVLNNALRRGELVRPDQCSECGLADHRNHRGQSIIHAHHHAGYDKPLEIQWLCTRCHAAAHHGALAEEGA